MSSVASRSSREGIHYWKCDRAVPFFGTTRSAEERADVSLMAQVLAVLPGDLKGGTARLEPAGGQGNHLTYILHGAGGRNFVRVEDGPERDDYMEVESALLRHLRAAGVPVPAVLACDATRRHAPFAWHVLEIIDDPDLNTHLKAGGLDGPAVFAAIGAWIAVWQERVPVHGHGPFDLARLRADGRLSGLATNARAQYLLNLDRHLATLVRHGFLEEGESDGIGQTLERGSALLGDGNPVLVHKDMALWNVLGRPDTVTAFVDWDDAVGGDALEDLALLACFHPAGLVRVAIEAYAVRRPLPPGWQARFWLHLARNMIVKAVIRAGAGYFDGAGGAFLQGTGGGSALRAFTKARLRVALDGLRAGRETIDYD